VQLQVATLNIRGIALGSTPPNWTKQKIVLGLCSSNQALIVPWHL
jgi:hypothetical protein